MDEWFKIDKDDVLELKKQKKDNIKDETDDEENQDYFHAKNYIT